MFFVLGNEKVPQVSERTGECTRAGRGESECIAQHQPARFCLSITVLMSPFKTKSVHIKQVWGIGLLNIFMCQFPFDLDAGVETKVLAVLAGYDYVLLNSQFSYQV